VRVPEMLGVDFRGAVSRIASALQPGTRTLLTEIDVTNREGLLTPGTYCEVELQIPGKTDSLIVPAEAVIFSRNGLSVAIVAAPFTCTHSQWSVITAPPLRSAPGSRKATR
jgi:multidrug efflux pump subunit AcrA (membrane-fusion protein)